MSKKQNSIQMVIDDLEVGLVENEDIAKWTVSVKNNMNGELSIKTVETMFVADIIRDFFINDNSIFWFDFMMDCYTESGHRDMSEEELAGYGDSQERF